MSAQSSGKDRDQIITEKPQTPSVKSFLIQANLGTHELGLREGFKGKSKLMSTQKQGTSGLNSRLEGSLKGKGRSRPTSMEEECDIRHGFQSQDQIATFSELLQIVPN